MSIISKITSFARSKQGKEAIEKVKDAADDPKTKKKVTDAADDVVDAVKKRT